MLEPEEDVAAFLGIEFCKKQNGKHELIQPHLINCVIETVFGTSDSNAKETCTSNHPLCRGG